MQVPFDIQESEVSCMSFPKGNQYGSKPRYKTPEEMQVKIDEYFEECKGTLLRDHNGDPILTRWGDPVFLDKRPPTLTGLALALGFKSRQALLTYQAKKEFVDTLLKARARVEQYNEEQLYTRDGAKGAMFNLQRNFALWQGDDTQNKGVAVNIINDIPKGTVSVNTDTAVFNQLQKPEETEQDAGK